MSNLRLLAAALLVAAACAPHAAAQVPPDSLVLALTQPATPIPYTGSVEAHFTLTAGCGHVLQGTDPQEQTARAEVAVADAPSWLTVTPGFVHFDPADCVGSPSGTATASSTDEDAAPLLLTAAKEAPGVVIHTVNATARFAMAAPQQAPKSSEAMPVHFTVAYHSEYTVVPSIGFPATVTGGVLHFNVTVTQKSNARSMVMFEDVKETAGKVSGLASLVYDPANRKTLAVPCGGNPPTEATQSKELCIRYQAPNGPWTRANVTFTNFGHYLLLDQRAGTYMTPKATVWGFVNGDPAGTEGSEGSPLPLPLLALAGAALLARRKRA